MPNWCEGVLKVRGTKEDIKRFLTEGLHPIGSGLFGEIPEKAEIEEDDWEFSIKTKNGFYVKGSRRNFIENNIDFYLDTDEEIKVLVIDGYKAAWAIEAQPLADLSKQFNVDFRIYAFERGQEFNQEIEIHKGEIVKNLEIEFEYYDWECIFPNLGG